MKDKLDKAVDKLKPVNTFFSKVVHIIKQWKGLVVFLNVKGMQKEALEWTNEITQRGGIYSSSIVPADLRNTKNRTILSKSGKKIAGLCLPKDWNGGSDPGISQLYIAIVFSLMILLNVLGITGLGNIASSFNFFMIASVIGSIVGTFLTVMLVAKFLFMVNMKTFLKPMGIFLSIALAYIAINLNIDSWIFTTFLYIVPAFIIFASSYREDMKRALELRKQVGAHGGTLNEKFVNSEKLSNPLVNQISNALKDSTPYIESGTALGNFQDQGDINAPESGNTIGFTLQDLYTHLFVFGKSGGGKSRYLRYLAYKLYAIERMSGKKMGYLVLDGKGDLAYELEATLDAIIAPHLVKNLMIFGDLRPEQIVEVILNASGSNQNAGANEIFRLGGAELLYYSLLTRQKLLEMKSLDNQSEDFMKATSSISGSTNYIIKLGKMLTEVGTFIDGKFSHPIVSILEFHPNLFSDKGITKILDYITLNQNKENQETIQSFFANFMSWLSPLTQNESLYDWADSETSDIDILDILKGAKYGVSLPPEKYGNAGRIITQLLKARLSNALAQRKADWRNDKTQTQVMLIIDECQDIISDDDVDQSQKGRSRGVSYIFATQHLTNLINKLGSKEKAHALLLSFSNYVMLETDNEDTDNFMSEVIGKIKVVTSSAPQGNPIDFATTSNNFMRSPEFDASHPEAHAMKFAGDLDATKLIYDRKNSSDELDKYRGLSEYMTDPNNPVRALYTEANKKSLERPGLALVRFKRALFPRSDIVKIHGISTEELEVLVAEVKAQYPDIKEAA
ncbi:TraM recognition site of TraD and TraG [Methylophilus rhizosphaerae]|uniref:TraM recognition site of TraD and TraG n=1 Tax=Methylophilus rhizosphaerae TaxID=492660 RepID=A0A1G9A9E9_9PROT|nr:TraM recognition domain-containing protein [Methylophilus rhizosphaerae]SDK23235.1 TraM recognition site of TraD and TraG [Methylophilus rhizosphaerae]